MDFDDDYLEGVLSGLQSNIDLIAAASSRLVNQSAELNQAMASGDYERSSQIIREQSGTQGADASGGSQGPSGAETGGNGSDIDISGTSGEVGRA